MTCRQASSGYSHVVCGRPADAGVVDENVDAGERGQGRVARLLDAGIVGHIDGKRLDPAAALQLLHGLLAEPAVAIPDGDGGAGVEKALGDRTSDALGPAGDDREAAIEVDPVGHAGLRRAEAYSAALVCGCRASRLPPRRRPRSIVRRMLEGLTLIESMPSCGKVAGDFRIVGRCFAADADMAAVALGAEHGEPEHLQHAGIALVEIEGDDLGITVHAQRELGQVVGADRKSIEQLGKGVDLDDVVGDLAHDVDLKTVLAALQTVACHGLEHAPRFLDPPAEGNHDAQIGQPHVLAHAAQRGTFEREAGGIGRVRVACRTAEAEHRILFLGLEALTAEQPRVLVGLEIGQADDHGLGIEGGCDHAHALREPFDEIIGRAWVVAHQPLDGRSVRLSTSPSPD